MTAFTTRAAGDWSSAGDGAGHGTVDSNKDRTSVTIGS